MVQVNADRGEDAPIDPQGEGSIGVQEKNHQGAQKEEGNPMTNDWVRGRDRGDHDSIWPEHLHSDQDQKNGEGFSNPVGVRA